MVPGRATVIGLVDAVAPGHGVARVVLPRAHPDLIGVGWRDGHGSDRARILVGELVFVGNPVVRGLENDQFQDRIAPALSSSCYNVC